MEKDYELKREESDKWVVCSWCDPENKATREIEWDERKKAHLIGNHYRKKIVSHGICQLHLEEERDRYKKPAGVDLEKKPEPMSEAEFQRIVDEVSAPYIPRPSFNLQDWEKGDVRGKGILPPGDTRM